MKKLIQSFLTVFTIVFTVGMGFMMISDQDVASYHGEQTYEHTYAEGILADKVVDREIADLSERDTNIYHDGQLLADQSTND